MKLTTADLHAKGYRPAGDGKYMRIATDQTQNSDLGAYLAHMEKQTCKPIRIPKRRGPNATEARWLLYAKHSGGMPLEFGMLEWRYEAFSFRLKSGAIYTPDWTGWDRNTLKYAVEVKGPHAHASHGRSVLAWKTAAAEWSHVTFIFARWTGSEWEETQMNPTTNR